jgi:hypothetical protein
MAYMKLAATRGEWSHEFEGSNLLALGCVLLLSTWDPTSWGPGHANTLFTALSLLVSSWRSKDSTVKGQAPAAILAASQKLYGRVKTFGSTSDFKT